MSAVRLREPKATLIATSIALACALGVIATLSTESLGMQFAAALGCLLLALGTAHVIARRGSGDSLNLLSLSGLFYLIAFFAGALYVWFNPNLNLGHGASVLPRSAITGAVAMATAAWIAFAGGYIADPFRLVRAVVTPPQHLAGRAPVAPLVVCLIAIGWLARVLLIASGRYYHIHTSPVTPTSSSWFISMGALLPLLALGIAGAEVFGLGGTVPNRRWRIPFVVLFVTELAWAVPSGAREEVVEVLAAAVIVRYYAAGRLPSWKASLALLLTLIFIVFPLLHAYRLGNFRSSPTAALVSATTQLKPNNLGQTLKSGGDTLARFADVASVARILQVGREQMGLSSQSTAEYALEDFIPRAILPGKSNFAALGNAFGRTYRFISPSDFITSISITEPGELYLGGGWLALLLGMVILGGFLRLLDEYLRCRRWDAGMLALYAVIAPLLVVGLETSIAVGFFGAIKAAIFLALFVVVLAWPLPRVRRSKRDALGWTAAQ